MDVIYVATNTCFFSHEPESMLRDCRHTEIRLLPTVLGRKKVAHLSTSIHPHLYRFTLLLAIRLFILSEQGDWKGKRE